MRAAVSSTDGKVVNQHFGKADKFHIFDLRDGGFHYVETRETAPCCRERSHDREGFDQTAEKLKDCGIIVVSMIGAGAAEYLENKGFVIYEAPYFIEDVLKEIIKEEQI